MFICICNALSESEIDCCIRQKQCRKAEDVFAELSCQAQCGKCRCEIRDMIKDHRTGNASTGPRPTNTDTPPTAPPFNIPVRL